MLVFVLGSSNHASAEATKANLAHIASEWTIVIINDNVASIMNDHLQDYEEPFFITLQAGDLLHSHFISELERQLASLPEHCAGLIYERGPQAARKDIPFDPLVWRTNAMRSTGRTCFPERDQMPFDSYIFTDKMLQISKRWEWGTFRSQWWQPQTDKIPPWRKMEEEWELVRPILETGTAATAPITKPSPLISIVICTFNNVDYLPWSIRSVLAQSIPDWELIIVDDASTDMTQQKLSALPEDPRIRIVTNAMNLGKSRCLNIALTKTEAPWLLELDADDWLPPDSIQTLLAYTREAKPETALLYGDHYEWTERARKQLIYGGICKAPNDFQAETLLSGAVPLAPRCYLVESLRSINGWSVDDPYGGRLYEDFAIILRLSHAYKISRVPKPLYHRRLRSSSITHQNSDKYTRWAEWMRGQMVVNRGGGGDSSAT
ncbi:glycosyltransferase [Paenibacillus sedimenti]|uniref:Glycosyltransferase n=1 Tax=Paenibacillus sedimenti TaxID=2770274 RepID=A0A926KPN6_9BACL|nr:glycosyltransferase [Paenibacillus sedimenti]MBD0381600.1 glycosyltransferase [Paenibacillus sedimenti]